MATHTPEEHARLYGELRAQVLGRFFAYGRYFRANHLSIENRLAVVRDDRNQPPPNAGDQDDIAVDCGSRAEARPGSYACAAALAALSPDQQEIERWRIAEHNAENPLMFTCQLLVALAVETRLGCRGALPTLRLVIDGLAAMYKFTNIGGYEGYPIRHDAVASDRWQTRDQAGVSVPWFCCDFMVNADYRHLFCTPFNHPGYVPYDPTEFYAEDPTQPGHWRTYSGNDDWPPRKDSLQRYRSWEPSMDELAGLIPAYDFVFFLVGDPLLRAEIQTQVENLSTYLSRHGYLLVRPGGGFAARGASGVLPALEFPFSRVFTRITGQPPAPAASFEQALVDAGVWDAMKTSIQWGGVVGIVAVGAIAGGIGNLLGLTLGFGVFNALAPIFSALGAVAGYFLGRAAGIYLAQEHLDVWDASSRSEFAPCYLLKLLSTRFRFTQWMSNVGKGKFARNFPQFIGLAGVADTTDTTVRDAFLASLPDARNDRTGTKGNTGFASAVAVALGQTSEEATLRGFLDRSYDCFDGNCQFNPPDPGKPVQGVRVPRMPMLDDEGAIVAEKLREPLPSIGIEDPMNALEYMACLALGWLRAQQLIDMGQTPATDLLPLPANNPPWPDVSVPTAVLQAGIVPALKGIDGSQGPLLLFPNDDAGSIRQAARPPDVPPQAPPIVSVQTVTVSVPESQMLVDPQVAILAGDTVTVAATDTIWAGVWLSGRNGPNGWTALTTDKNYPRTGTNRYCLLYKIVPAGMDFAKVPWSKLGTSLAFAAVDASLCGNLYFRINDDVPGNGNGAFSCTITIARAGS